MYMYIVIYVCIRVYLCMRVCVYVYMRVCVYMCMCVFVYVFICVCVCMCVCHCMCVSACIFVYMCICVRGWRPKWVRCPFAESCSWRFAAVSPHVGRGSGSRGLRHALGCTVIRGRISQAWRILVTLRWFMWLGTGAFQWLHGLIRCIVACEQANGSVSR